MMLCCLCGRPAGRIPMPIPLCIACRTKIIHERTAAAATAAEANPEPIVLSLTSSPYEIFAGQYGMRMACDGALVP
jgi:hypothetical protein